MIFAVRTCLSKYFTFSGRAARSEFWFWTLFFVIGSIVLIFVDASFALYGIFVLLTFLPSLAVTVRRLHDINSSGWWLLISLVPYIGGLILLYWLLQKSDDGANYYGSLDGYIKPQHQDYENRQTVYPSPKPAIDKEPRLTHKVTPKLQAKPITQNENSKANASSQVQEKTEVVVQSKKKIFSIINHDNMYLRDELNAACKFNDTAEILRLFTRIGFTIKNKQAPFDIKSPSGDAHVFQDSVALIAFVKQIIRDDQLFVER
mgnify:CR=1 FL=1